MQNWSEFTSESKILTQNTVPLHKSHVSHAIQLQTSHFYKKKNCLDLSNKTIRQVIPFFALCDLYVGNDSFMHHVTSQSQKPAIVLLINSPRAYTDYSKYYHRIIPENANLNKIDHSFLYSPSSITVKMVEEKILEIKNK